MKISVKGIAKAVLGGATIIGGAILAIQGKKALSQDEYAPELEPNAAGNDGNEPETETTTETPAEEESSKEEEA